MAGTRATAENSWTKQEKIAAAVGLTVYAIGVAVTVFGAVETYKAVPLQGSLFGGVTLQCPFVTKSYTKDDPYKHDCYTSNSHDIDEWCRGKHEQYGRCFYQVFTLALNCTRYGITRLFEEQCLAACNGGWGRLHDFMNSTTFPKGPVWYDDGRNSTARGFSVAAVVLGGLALSFCFARCGVPSLVNCLGKRLKPSTESEESDSTFPLLGPEPKRSCLMRAASAFRNALPCCRKSPRPAAHDMSTHPIHRYGAAGAAQA